MLNIPDEIKALYKTDSVRKNFRVHFPNGENPDLTNSDIVAGSVQFTESICSKDVLQFGLAEASRIEFECVNVPNIYGAVIECYNEIDATDADAQYQTTMPDLDYPVYQIPLGVFTVTSCPRSAGAMWRRRVEAYGNLMHISDNLSDLLSYKIGVMTGGFFQSNAFIQNLDLLLATEMNDISDLALTESTVSLSTKSVSMNDFSIPRINYTNGDYYTVYVGNVTYHYADISAEIDSIYRFTSSPNTSTYDQIIRDMIDDGMPVNYVSDVRNVLQANIIYDNYVGKTYGFQNQADSGYVYPYLNRGTNTGYTPHTEIGYMDYGTVTVEAYHNGNTYTLGTYNIGTYISSPTLKKYTMSGGIHYRFTTNNAYDGTYIYTGAIKLSEILPAYYELSGTFLANGRDKPYKLTLSKSSPITMPTNEYSSLWWDEYDISPIGAVQVTYKDADTNTECTIVYDVADGLSIYDMSNNYLLKNLTMTSSELGMSVEDYVIELLTTYFIPNVQDIAFTPVQLDALGLPYLEVGDYLEIDDGNGNTVGTYIMSRTLSGVQFLEDDIESKGGEIIGNVRNA